MTGFVGNVETDRDNVQKIRLAFQICPGVKIKLVCACCKCAAIQQRAVYPASIIGHMAGNKPHLTFFNPVQINFKPRRRHAVHGVQYMCCQFRHNLSFI